MKAWHWQLIAAVLLAIIIFLGYKSCTYKSDELPVAKTDTVVRWMGSDSSYWQTLITLKDQRYSNMEARYKDSIAKILRVASSQVSELITANLKADAVIESLSHTDIDYAAPVGDCPPEAKAFSHHFKNKWYDVNTRITKDGPGSVLKFTAYDSLKVVRSKVFTGNFFNRQQYQRLDIGFSNPYVMVSGVKSFTIPPPKPKKFTISFVAGYGYVLDNSLQRKPFIGIAAGYSIIRF